MILLLEAYWQASALLDLDSILAHGDHGCAANSVADRGVVLDDRLSAWTSTHSSLSPTGDPLVLCGDR